MFRFQLVREAVIFDNYRQDDIHHVYCATSLKPRKNTKGLLVLEIGKALYLQYEVTIFCTRFYPPPPPPPPPRVGFRCWT